MTERKHKLAMNLGAAGVALSVTAVIQFLSVPLYLAVWPAELYGNWLTIGSLSALFTVAEIGLLAPLANRLSVFMLRQDEDQASRLLATTVLGVTWNYVVVVVVVWLSVRPSVAALLGAGAIDAASVRVLLVLQTTYLWLYFLTDVLSGLYRASDRFAAGAILGNAARLVDFLSAYAFLLATRDPLYVAAAPLISRAAMVIYMAARTATFAKWAYRARVGGLFREPLSKDLHYAGFGSLASLFSTAVMIQLPILFLSRYFGGEKVALFSTTRTLARIPVQIGGALQMALMPELTRVLELREASAARRIVHGAIATLLVLGIAVMTGLAVAGDSFFLFWTHGRLGTDMQLMALLTAASIVSMLSGVAATVLNSQNHYVRVAKITLSVYALILCIWFVTPSSQLVTVIALTILFGECVIFAGLFKSAAGILEESPSAVVFNGMRRLGQWFGISRA